MTSKYNNKEKVTDRRGFIKKIAAAGGVIAGAGILGGIFYSNKPVRGEKEKVFTFKTYRIPESAQYPSFVAAKGKDVDKALSAALDKLGGVSRFINEGEKVLIKPNVGWDRQPEQAANTNPDLVGAMVRLCLSAGASEVCVTDVSINDPYRSFARSGIEASVKKAGGKVKYNTEQDFIETDLEGEVLKTWPVSRFYHEVDRVINMPVVKHHSLSKASISMKNWYGILGGRRNRLHQDIHTSIVDLASAVRPTLTVVDATRVLFQNGPTGGNLSDVSTQNTVIVGTDEVALDSYCLKYLNLTPEDVHYLGMAVKRGLGVAEWKTLNYLELEV
jgi:uncharacterized protein (DUF362 family)